MFDALPLFSQISHPFRFVVGVSLAISLLAAHGLRHMTRHSTARTRWALVLTLCVAGLLEYRFGSPATLPIPTSGDEAEGVQRYAIGP